MRRRTKLTDCMDSRPVGGGSTSAVRVFTCFVLSGSLFLLIYNVGRRRMNQRNFHSSVRETSVITNPSSQGGYFSHHKDKPLTRHRKPSLTAALETFPSTLVVDGNASSSDHADETTAATPDDGRGSGRITSSDSPDSNSRSHDTEAGPSKLTRRYSGASQASHSDLEPSSSTTGHEGQMIEHMRGARRLSDSQGSIPSIKLDAQKRRSSCSFLGDMSHLETFMGTALGSQTTADVPKVSAMADVQTEDPYGRTSSSPQRYSATARAQFLKPLIYIFIWSALSFSVHVYSSTGWGAKMTKFPAPFLKATVHFLMQAVMSSCMLRWPRNNVFVMPWNTYMLIVVPIATAAALDHDLRDASFFMVTLGIPTLTKPAGILDHAYVMFSSLKDATLETVWDGRMQSKGYVPLCVFLFALAFRLESRSVPIAVSVAIIAVGFILGVSNETKFGVMSLKESSFGPLLSGFRWAAIQILLQKRELGLVTPVVTMRALAPSMAMVTALLSVFAEPWSTLLTTEEYFDDPEQAFKSGCHIIIGALLGTAVALSELVVVYHTSALTLIILGILKDLCVVVPRMIQDNQLSEQNILGFAIFSLGLVSLIWLKYQKHIKKNRVEGPSEDTQSVASGISIDRWPGIGATGFTSLVYRSPHTTGYLGRAQEAGSRISRKLYALWQLAS